jgi:NDP-sugar pyrophosphorylase family protein
MKALIFAAGLGVRMRPLTDTMPKPLLEVAGKPLLAHIMDALPEEITEIILVVGYKGELIREYFQGNFHGRAITYVEQKEQKGTGDALMLTKDLLAEGEKFLLVYADDLRDKESLRRGLAHEYAIFVKEMEEPVQFGTVVADESGRILDIEEKVEHPRSNLVVTGAYVLTTKIFDYPPSIEKNGEYYINSMLRALMKDVLVYAEPSAIWIPIGYPEDLARADKFLKDGGAL